MKYTKKFNSIEDYNTFKNSANYIEPNISAVNETTIFYNSYEDNPLTFEILREGQIGWHANSLTKTIEYSLNGGTWTSITSTNAGVYINVEKGDILQFRGNNTAYGTNSDWCHFVTANNVLCNVSGNILSLIDKTNFKTYTTALSSYCFYSLFRSCVGIKSVKNLILNSTNLGSNCYRYMLAGCVSLKDSPKLPALTMTEKCYQGMFSDCHNLIKAPELPATTLAPYCYADMFWHCEILQNPPSVLPATTLATYCYSEMFHYCHMLERTPQFAPTTLAQYCCLRMFDECVSLKTTIDILPATTLQNYCYAYMFYGCANLEVAPILPATTLVTRCYDRMFTWCRQLRYIKAMFTTSPSSDYCYDAFLYCGSEYSGTKTFVKNSAATWSNGYESIGYVPPQGWTVTTASS